MSKNLILESNGEVYELNLSSRGLAAHNVLKLENEFEKNM